MGGEFVIWESTAATQLFKPYLNIFDLLILMIHGMTWRLRWEAAKALVHVLVRSSAIQALIDLLSDEELDIAVDG